VVGFFGAVDTFAAFDESGFVVVGGGGVEAEVVVPLAVFDAVADVGFAEHRGLVTGIVEEVGEEGDIGGEWSGCDLFVVECSRGAGPEAGESCGAGGSAEGVGTEGVAEADTFAADAILVGRLEDGMAGDAEGVGALAFGIDEEQVGTLGSGRRGCECERGCGGHGTGDSEAALEEFAAGWSEVAQTMLLQYVWCRRS